MTIRSAAGVAAAAAFACSASIAAAQPRPIEKLDQTATVEALNEQSIDAALGVVTGNQIISVDGNGDPIVIATATNGLRFEIHFRACDQAPGGEQPSASRNCRAMYMMAAWDLIDEDEKARFNEAAIAFQRDNPTVNAGRFDNGAPYLLRYVIADYGTKQGNLVSEFANFIRSATNFQNAIAPLYLQAAPAE